MITANGDSLPAKKKVPVVPPYNNIYAMSAGRRKWHITDASGNSIKTKRSIKEFFVSYKKLCFAMFKRIDKEY